MASASRSTITGRVAFGGKTENITDHTLEEYQTHYSDKEITKKDIFYYVYGLLHHKGYRKKYADNLNRELPRIPMAPDFWSFSRTGQALAWLHLNYETCERYGLKQKAKFGNLEKMAYPKIEKDGKKVTDKTKLRINRIDALEGLPKTEYRVNGRSPLEWAIDRYKITPPDADSGIVNDPTEGMTEEKTVAMIERLVYVAVKSDELVKKLPKEFEPKGWKPQEQGIEHQILKASEG